MVAKKQLAYMVNEIINGDNKDKFKVINIEAGVGKTLETERALVDLYKLNPKVKTLFVQRFVEGIKDSQNRINELAGKNIALGLHSDNFKPYKNELDNYNILIITHEKYKRLAQDKRQRKLFANGRRNLIIDEMINMVEIIQYNYTNVERFSTLLPNGLRNIYNQCIKELTNLMVSQKKHYFYNTKTDVSKQLTRLRQLVKSNVNYQYLQKINILYNSEKKITKNDFLKEIDRLKEFYNKTILVNNENLYTYNSKIQYWLLDNNIMLDANGGFQYLYKISDIFCTKNKQSKILNHKNWTIHIAELNTTKTAKGKYIDFYEQVNKKIEEIITPNDKLLIVGNKSEEENNKYIKKDNVDIGYFGNITGRNCWREYNKIFIPHTPNIPYHVYVLNYMYYSGKNFNSRSNWRTSRGKFNKKEFEKVRVSYLVGELYQAIKRINRDMKDFADVYLMFKNDDVLRLLIKQFKNIEQRCFEVDVKETENQTNNKTVTQHEQFIKVLSSLNKGIYTKKELRERIGVKNASNFTNRVLNNHVVVKYMHDNNIKNSGRNIIIN